MNTNQSKSSRQMNLEQIRDNQLRGNLATKKVISIILKYQILFSRDLDLDYKFITREKLNQIPEFHPNITTNEENQHSMQDDGQINNGEENQYQKPQKSRFQAPRFNKTDINNQFKESNINSYSMKGTPNIISKNKNKNSFQSPKAETKKDEEIKLEIEYKDVKNRELNLCNEGNAKLFDEPKEGEEGFLHTNEIIESRQLKSTFLHESPTKGSKKDEEAKLEEDKEQKQLREFQESSIDPNLKISENNLEIVCFNLFLVELNKNVLTKSKKPKNMWMVWFTACSSKIGEFQNISEVDFTAKFKKSAEIYNKQTKRDYQKQQKPQKEKLKLACKNEMPDLIETNIIGSRNINKNQQTKKEDDVIIKTDKIKNEELTVIKSEEQLINNTIENNKTRENNEEGDAKLFEEPINGEESFLHSTFARNSSHKGGNIKFENENILNVQENKCISDDEDQEIVHKYYSQHKIKHEDPFGWIENDIQVTCLKYYQNKDHRLDLTNEEKKEWSTKRKTDRVLKKLINYSKKLKNWEDVKTMLNLPSQFNSDFEKIMVNFNEYVKSKLNKKDCYIFDGIYFESIEKIGTFQPIVNLKSAIKQDNYKEQSDCEVILENQYSQLHEFMLKQKESFNKFFRMDDNASLTLNM